MRKTRKSSDRQKEIIQFNGMIKRDPTKPRAIDILDERPWRQNVPVPMLMGIHKGAALFSERNIRDVYSFPQDMLGTHKKTYLLHMPDDGLQEAGIAEGDVLFITPQEFANDSPMISTLSSRRRRAARSSATSARTRMALTCSVRLGRPMARSRARMLSRLSHA